MEVSISGAGCRPTIAAALYGDAAAVAAMAALDPRNDALVAEFAAYVNFSRASLERLWNENISSFAVLPCDAPPRRSREPTPTRLELRNAAPIVAADPCDLGAVRVPGEPVDVRELLAYAPFAFEGLVDESRDYEPMFAELFDERGFAAPFGLTTAERRHPCFNYSWAHGDTWSLGCVFFETVAGRPLNAMAHDDDTIVAQFREAAAARGLPGLFPRVFERILRRDPDDRPSSSDVLAAFDDETPPLGKSGSARVAPAPPDETVAAVEAKAAPPRRGVVVVEDLGDDAEAASLQAAWRQRQLKRRASSSKPKPPAPRPAPAPAAPKPPPSREVERLASFLKEALDDAEPPRDAAADERKARQRAAEDAKAIAELERGAASVRDFHRARTADRRRPSAREPRFQQSQTSPRLP
jgi:hypothetical protein